MIDVDATPKILDLDLRQDLQALPRARDAIRGWLDSSRDADLVGVVELLTTELLANAVEHGNGSTGARLVLLDEAVRIEVGDRSAQMPRIAKREPADPGGGRGLRLVAALSDGWGAEPNGSGKLTWCEVPLTSPSTSVWPDRGLHRPPSG